VHPTESPTATALRERLRALVAAHLPTGFLGAFSDDPADLARTQAFCKVLAAEGLLVLGWPPEYGGAGASVWEQTVLREEMWAHHEPRGPQYMGLNWVGPALVRHGSPAQKAHHLPAIAAGDVIWCQGFSEPDAGSDLGALRTLAVVDGDSWSVTGQKVWTSYAQMAQWCVLATCTDPEASTSRRITLFLIPMDRAGVQVRPIASMLGPHHLNEVFLDGVRVGPEDVLGEIGNGWQVIRDALAHERVGIARYARCDALLARLLDALDDESWSALPDGVRTRWVRMVLQLRVARLLAYAAVAQQESGEPDPAAASLARIQTTTCDQLTAELLLDAVGAAGLDGGPLAPLQGAIDDHWRYAQAATVSSGTIEVQRMLVARAALGAAAIGTRPARHKQDAAVALGQSVRGRFQKLGGVRFALAAEADPDLRCQAAQALADVGIGDIDVHSGAEQLRVGAELCRVVGALAVPWPVADALVGRDRLVSLVSPATPRIDHGDLAGPRIVCDLDGRSWTTKGHHRSGGRLGPFVVTAELLADGPPVPAGAVSRLLLLGSWRILGALEAALGQVSAHVVTRRQFGRPLSEFQAVAFAVADATVAVRGLEELAGWTTQQLGSVDVGQGRVDALGLRVYAVDAARLVLRTCHQLLGAVGFCDEHDVSVLDRHLQPALRLPLSADGLAETLHAPVRIGALHDLFAPRAASRPGSLSPRG
jgi:alkylation response protein AidB-like acyl-CoA dehydrogenase